MAKGSIRLKPTSKKVNSTPKGGYDSTFEFEVSKVIKEVLSTTLKGWSTIPDIYMSEENIKSDKAHLPLLQPTQLLSGNKSPMVRVYTPDFILCEKSADASFLRGGHKQGREFKPAGKVIVIEAKGYANEAFPLRWDMFLYCYGSKVYDLLLKQQMKRRRLYSWETHLKSTILKYAGKK